MCRGKRLVKNGRRVNSYLLSRALLLCAVAKVALAAVALGCVCGLRYAGSRGGWHSDLIENNKKLAVGKGSQKMEGG